MVLQNLREDMEEWDGKHPLENSWVLWYFNPILSQRWGDCMKKVGSFATIEDFWRYMNHLRVPTQMSTGRDLCLFKEGISPTWEDLANKYGGRWHIGLDKASFSTDSLNEFWLNMTMDLVGHRFAGYDDLINGVVVSKRVNGIRISLWTSSYHNQGKLLSLGKMLKSCLGIPASLKLSFRTHEDCASSSTCHIVLHKV